VTSFPLPSGGGTATSIAAGPSGVWFLDPSASRVGRVDAAGHVVEFAVPTPSFTSLPAGSSFAVGPNGDAYYIPQAGNNSYLVQVAPDGSTTNILLPGSISSGLFAGPDGVYFPITAAGVGLPPYSPGPVGNNLQLDRIGADGVVTPALTTAPITYSDTGFLFGPDGNLWFTENNPALIGRIDLNPATVPSTGPTLVASGIAPGRVALASGPALGLFAASGEPTTLTLAGFRHSADVSILSTSIDWGDGTSPTAGSLGSASGDDTNPGDNPFIDGQISGSHVYAQAGSYNVTVTIQAVGPDGSAMSTKAVAKVSAVDPAPASQSPPLTLLAGKSLAFQGPLAIFSTPTPHESSGSDFSATIDWGDGTPATEGTVTGGSEYSYLTGINPGGVTTSTFTPSVPPGLVNIFEVTGGHIYSKVGSFTVKVTLQDQFGHSTTESSPIQVVPGPLAVVPITPANPVASSYPPFSSPSGSSIDLGTLTDLRGSVAGQTDSVTVDWGDGTTPNPGSVIPTGNLAMGSSGTTSDIQGSHTYAIPGKYTIHYTVTDSQGDSVEASTTYQASAPSLQLTPLPLSISAGDPINGAVLASLTPINSTDPAVAFTATINWGDGSKPTPGTVVPGGPVYPSMTGTLNVLGSHTYATPGLYTMTVSVQGPGGSTAQINSTAAVTFSSAQSDVIDTSPPPVFTQGVASLPKPLGNLQLPTGTLATDFQAMVNWGDGSMPTPATLVPGISTQTSQSLLAINASHDYAQAGSFPITISAVGRDGIPVLINLSATVSAPPPPVLPIVVPANPPILPTLPHTMPIASPRPLPGPILAPVSIPRSTVLPLPTPTAAMILPSPFPRFAPTVVMNTQPEPHLKTRHHVSASSERVAPPKSKPKAHPSGPAHASRTRH